MKYLSIDLPEAWGQSDPNIYRQDEGGVIEVLTNDGEWHVSGAWGDGSKINTLEALAKFFSEGGGSTWRVEWLKEEDIALLRAG